jgi:hypothetical protein
MSTSAEQLRSFCRSGDERVQRAIDLEDLPRLRTTLEAVARSRTAMAGTFTRWAADTLAFVRESEGPAAMAALLAPEHLIGLAAADGITAAQAALARDVLGADAQVHDELLDLVEHGNVAAAKALWRSSRRPGAARTPCAVTG